MTEGPNSKNGAHYTPAAIVKALQEAQPVPTAGSSPEPAGDLLIQNPPFGAHSKNAG